LAPTPFETLVALWAGDLAPQAADVVEGHLFSCDACAAVSDQLGKLVAGLREIILPVISHARRDRLVAGGTRIRQTMVVAGIQAEARFAPEVDLLVHVLQADLSRAERVDVELVDEHGIPRIQLPYVPFDRSAGEVLVACQRHYQHMFPTDPVFQVHVLEGGVRRQVGTYVVRHHWE
jgi:hypothetical protein